MANLTLIIKMVRFTNKIDKTHSLVPCRQGSDQFWSVVEIGNTKWQLFRVFSLKRQKQLELDSNDVEGRQLVVLS